ncbi:class I SAM-dependent methyltransferase [Spirosoma rhododendri]|uniref:Class I SAM-dependent methyltransferase n=1 Tax=Spirosoma rhododendri TaxID=2728024 RepID=A0A7L5DQS4_9BACT|nr:class I SAM-dependent methyltransferase [Spirosoma rhododendri]QJD80505.1 class I SAM-dependent methyltransferase [Spirosoma rhododendri]
MLTDVKRRVYTWEDAEAPHSCHYVTPKVIECVEALRPRRILDMGAGNGALCADLVRAGYDAVGTDYDEKGIDIARQTYPNLTFYAYGVQHDPAEMLETEEKFDMVVSTEVVEHLYNPHQLFTYASAVLNEGGYLLVTTPYHGYWKNLMITLLGKWDQHHAPLWYGGHIKFFSKQSLRQLFADTGFDPIEFHGVGRFPYFWKSMAVLGRKRS